MHGTFFLILGLAGLLLIASLLLPIANRLNFPYTVLLAVAGSVLGAIVLAVGGEVEGLWLLGDFLNTLNEFDITSEVVFFVFLPALIFESALNISVRHLLSDIGPILLLAILGLLISTFVVGFSVWAVSDVALVVCLLLGAIVSATDPVAVTAIFKDLGAPKRLNILVEGESLFNDATAIVMFTILAGILVGGGETGLLPAMGDFVKVFFGGVVVGVVLAWITVAIIGQLHKMPLIEITLTVCLAYFSFLFAEHYLHVSGVMAVVSAGLLTRSFGRTMVSPTTWHALIETWEQLGFWANSLIFFLVGLLVPKVLVDLGGVNLATLATLIAAAFAARAFVLYLLLPMMNHYELLGQRISVAYRTVMWWGGLRGAVSLALALVILESPEVAPEIKSFVVVLVTGFVLFTLFVNATTMKQLMRLLGLDKLPSADLAIRNRIMSLSLRHIRDDLEKAAEEYRIDAAIAREVADEYQRRQSQVEKQVTDAEVLSDDDLERLGLATLTNQESNLYLERFAQSLTSASVTRALLVQTDNLLDAIKTGGTEGYRQAVVDSLGFNRFFRFALALHRRYGWATLLAAQLANRFEVLRTTQAVVRELIAYTQEKSAALLGKNATKNLEAILHQRHDDTWEALNALRLQFPEYARTVQKRHLGRLALRLEDTDYRRMLNEQVLSQDVFNQLERDLDRRTRRLDRQPKLDLRQEPEKLVSQVPFFADLEPSRINAISKLLKPQLVIPGERIMRKGEVGTAMYFISTGAVEIALEPKPVKLGSGDFFGAIAMVTRQPRKMDAYALGYCQLLVLHIEDFHRLLAENPRLREKIDRIVAERLETWFKNDVNI